MNVKDQEKRLKKADEITRKMTKEEYAYFSECRQASFTHKKRQYLINYRLRFKEWVELDRLSETKINIDVQDILGFLACEIVSKITETAIEIKREWDATLRNHTTNVVAGLFDKPNDSQTALEPRHVKEAFRRMQKDPKFLQCFEGGLRKRRLDVI